MSYDYTCALSGLSIATEDCVYVIAMAKLPPPDLQNSAFLLAFPPIKAKYNGLGATKEAEPFAFHEEFAKKTGFENSQDFLCQLFNGQARMLKSNQWISHALVRQDAWTSMIHLCSTIRYADDFSDIATLAALGAQEGAERILKISKAFFSSDAGRKIEQEALSSGDAYTPERLFSLLLNGYILDGLPQNSHFASFYGPKLAKGGTADFFIGKTARELLILDMPRNFAKSDLVQALLICGQTEAVHNAMLLLRKTWAPGDVSGTRYGEPALQWLWSQTVGELAKSQIACSADAGKLIGIEQARSLIEHKDIEDACAHGVPSTKRNPSI